MTSRFIPLTEVAETLSISVHLARQLVLNGDLAAIKIGGRGEWRVEVSALEDYIQRQYAATRDLVDSHEPGDHLDHLEPLEADLTGRTG